jgi:hypothetical protein
VVVAAGGSRRESRAPPSADRPSSVQHLLGRAEAARRNMDPFAAEVMPHLRG